MSVNVCMGMWVHLYDCGGVHKDVCTFLYLCASSILNTLSVSDLGALP